ncbi:unnamed protein product [Prunus armeniaca]
MKSLRSLDISGSGIRELSPSIAYLTKLRELNLNGCFNFTRFATTFRLKSLEILHLRDCERLEIFLDLPLLSTNVFKGEAYRRGVFSGAMQGVSFEALLPRIIVFLAEPHRTCRSRNFFRFRVSRSGAPCSALQHLITPSHASGVFRPPRSKARSDERENMPLKTLLSTNSNISFLFVQIISWENIRS